MLRRLKNLWALSNLQIEKEKSSSSYVNPAFTADGIKERLGIKKMAHIVEDSPLEIFPDHKETI